MIIGTWDPAQRPLLIAEIGNNHEGSADAAVELADAAVAAGADAVKVQIIDPPRLVNIAQSERVAQLRRFQLSLDVFRKIARQVRSRGRLFLASVFDCDTLAEVQNDLDGIKIASGDLDFDPMLELAAASGRPVVLSTGMSTMAEITRAVGVFDAALPPGIRAADRLAVLHCVSLYPTPLGDANLRAIPRLAERLALTVGYSDHTLGIEAALVALALGARIIEKHFTLDKNRSSFRDHALSAEPREFAQLAHAMKYYDRMLGSGDREHVLADAPTRAAARRSIVAARPLSAGTLLQSGDLDYVRPAGGVPPSEARFVLGRRLKRPLEAHEQVSKLDLE